MAEKGQSYLRGIFFRIIVILRNIALYVHILHSTSSWAGQVLEVPKHEDFLSCPQVHLSVTPKEHCACDHCHHLLLVTRVDTIFLWLASIKFQHWKSLNRQAPLWAKVECGWTKALHGKGMIWALGSSSLSKALMSPCCCSVLCMSIEFNKYLLGDHTEPSAGLSTRERKKKVKVNPIFKEFSS